MMQSFWITHATNAEMRELTSSSSSPSTMDDDYYQSQISPLTDGQEIVLSILNLLSGAMSIFGSSTIVYKVIRNRQHTTPYDRIMLGLSVADIIASLSFMLSPFLVPSDTSQRVWASGSTSTCSFLGWMTQLGLSAVWYNGLLSFYYLFTVRCGMSRHVFAQKYETYFHLLTWIFFLTTASLGSAFHWYSEFQINQGCWLGEIPQGCEANDTCTGKGMLVGWIFGGFPTMFTFVAITINNLFIYAHVRHTMRQPTSILQVATSLTNKNTTTTSRPTTSTTKTPGMNSTLQGQVTSLRDPHQPTPPSSSSRHPPSSQRQARSEEIHYVEEVRRLRQQAQVKEVATQGFLYVATFFLSYTPAFAVRLMDGLGMGASQESQIYPLLVLNAFLLPLQGFFNMFVHTRPSYFRFRAAYPEFSRSWAMSHALFDKDIPRYSKAKFTTKAGRSSDHGVGGGNGGGRSGVHWRVSSSHNSQSGASWYSSSFAFSSNLDPVEEEKSQEEEQTTTGDNDDLQLQGMDRYITFVVAAPGLPGEMTSISLMEDDFDEHGGIKMVDSPTKQGEDASMSDTDNKNPSSVTSTALLECIPIQDIGMGFSSEQSPVPTSVEAEVSLESDHVVGREDS